MNMKGNTQTATYSSSEAFTASHFLCSQVSCIEVYHSFITVQSTDILDSPSLGNGWRIGHRHTNINYILIKPLLCSSILVNAPVLNSDSKEVLHCDVVTQHWSLENQNVQNKRSACGWHQFEDETAWRSWMLWRLRSSSDGYCAAAAGDGCNKGCGESCHC